MDTNPQTNPEVLSNAGKLITTIEQLAHVLDDEVEGVYTRKTEDMAKLYQQKTHLLADYASIVTTLRKAGDGWDVELPAEMTARIKTKSELLAKAMERNLKALRVAHEASQQVVNIIVEAVKQQRRAGTPYGKNRNGALVTSESGDGAASAVTLDTKL